MAELADVDARTGNFVTPLYIAAGLGHPTIVTTLLAAGANPDDDGPGVTPFAVAVALDRLPMIDAMRAAGGDEARARAEAPGFLGDPAKSVDGIVDLDRLGLSETNAPALHDAVRAAAPADFAAWLAAIAEATRALGGDPTREIARLEALRTMDAAAAAALADGAGSLV